MVFSSNIFLLFFLPIFLLAYFVTPQRFRNYTLLLASLVFYAFGAPDFILILVAACVVNYYLVKGMAKVKSPKAKKGLCALSVILALSLLLYYKYANFFVDNFCSIMGWLGNSKLSTLNSKLSRIALPIGISFFTFQSITYTIDVYRGTTQPSRSLTDYVLYIMMFPQLIAGPIVRYNSVAAQIISRQSTMEDRMTGFYRFVIGLAKKVLIANTLAQVADQAFGLGGGLSTGAAWIGMLSYTFQIYFDFSGYSDMAIGLGRMMGFTFPENFMNPYTSRSITEFWRRWHMTLGTFMKEYLYIPLGGNRKGAARTYLNLVIVFLCSGFWHGAAWTFVLWGAFHGLFQIFDRLGMAKVLDKMGKLPSMLLTFFVVNLGWVLFRADGVQQAGAFYQALFAFKGGAVLALDAHFWTVFALAAVFSFITLLKGGQKLQDGVFAETYTVKRSWVMFAVTALLFILSVGSLMVSDFNPFIYFRF